MQDNELPEGWGDNEDNNYENSSSPWDNSNNDTEKPEDLPRENKPSEKVLENCLHTIKPHSVNNSYTSCRNNTHHNSKQKKTTYHNTNQALKNNEDIESIYKFCKKICFGLCIAAVFVGGMYFMNKLTKDKQNKAIDISDKIAESKSDIAANTNSVNSSDDSKQDKAPEKKKSSSKNTTGNTETNSVETFNINDYPLYFERVKLIAYDLSEYDNYLDLSLEDVGYNLCDLNSDSSPELIIGYMNGRENSVSVGNNSIDFDTVIQIYVVYEGSLATLAQSDQRYGYYICNDNTVGYWGSGGASSGSYRYYKYTNDIFMDSIGNIDYEFDQSGNESFYYYADIYSDYYNNRKLISSDEAWKTVNEHSGKRLNYTPVSSVPATPDSIEYNWLSDDSYLGFGYVNTKDDLLNLRSGQSYDSKILGRIPYGEEISILNDFGEWYDIIYHGIYGYVRKEFVKTSYSDDNYNESSEYTADYEEPADAIAEGEVVTDNDILNLRSGASYDNSVLLKIPNHSIIKILSELDEWYYVWYNGTYGYVRKEFVELQ